MSSPSALSSSHLQPDLSTHFAAALRLLYEAHAYAASLGRDVWDFAVEITALREAGLSRSDLRWLACKGYVRHGIEAPATSEDQRCFHHEGMLTLAAGTCFVLTDFGATVARAVPGISEPSPSTPGAADEDLMPRWDSERRELLLGKKLVKHFLVPADNQEHILSAFQEEGWPPRIDDPLPPQRYLEPKRRLAEAIRRLNRNQKTRLLRFHSNGHGNGVCWELLRQTAWRLPGDCL
jgi:hypothetical protein